MNQFQMKINLKEVGQENMDWIYLAQTLQKWRTAVNTVPNLKIP